MENLINENSARDSFATLKMWMENRNAGKTFEQYFHAYGYKKIGIYGADDLGRLLYEELKGSDIQILFFVDRNAEGLNSIGEIPVIMLQELTTAEPIDSLIVTPAGNYDAICRTLASYVPEMPTMSLREAVYEF